MLCLEAGLLTLGCIEALGKRAVCVYCLLVLSHCLSQKAEQNHLLSEKLSLSLKQLDPYLQTHFLLWTDKFMSGYVKYLVISGDSSVRC